MLPEGLLYARAQPLLGTRGEPQGSAYLGESQTQEIKKQYCLFLKLTWEALRIQRTGT